MRSPFPGMDPFLENPELWSEVHSRLIVAIADDLTEQLSNRYRVAIEKRTYFSSGDDSLLVGIPDVSVMSRVEKSQPTELATRDTATLPSTDPITVAVPLIEETQERYLEVREVATGAVITAIELLSPKNKRSGEGRQAYERKRNQVLASLTHFIEIDLLRGGQPLPILGTVPSDYRILISRSDVRPSAQLFAFNVQQEIPSFPVPLAPGETEPLLNLQQIFQAVYQRGRYYLAVDYQKPIQPPLSAESAAWAADRLQQNHQ